jgi:hypothetical protein
MPTEHDTTETPDAAPDAAVGALEPEHRPDDTDPATVAAQIDGEAALREWEGLPPDAVILVPAFAAPMRLPDQAWAMLVLAVDIVGDTDPERAGEVELFAGSWLPDQPPADLYDGDLVVRLISRAVTRDKSERAGGMSPPMSRCCWRAEAAGSSSDGGVLSTSAGPGSSRRPPQR